MSCEGESLAEVTECQPSMEQSESEQRLAALAEAETTTGDGSERTDPEEATESSEEDEYGQCTSGNREIQIKRPCGKKWNEITELSEISKKRFFRVRNSTESAFEDLA